MQLLANIGLHNAPTYPDDMADEPWLIESCLMSMHKALKRGPRDHVIEDLLKKHTVNAKNYCHEHPGWMTLKPPQDLRVWAPILEEMTLDVRSVRNLVEVINNVHDGSHGYFEGNRIIAHLLKDTTRSEWRKGPSAWLHGACAESMQAMLNWEDWNNGRSSRPSMPSSMPSSRPSMPSSMPTDWNAYKPITRRGFR